MSPAAGEPHPGPFDPTAPKPLDPEPILRLPRRGSKAETTSPLPPPRLVRPEPRRDRWTLALFVWPSLSSAHLASALALLDQTVVAIRDRLGITLERLPPLGGKLVHRDPASYGLVPCDEAGACLHPAADLTLAFRPLQAASGQPLTESGGIATGTTGATRLPGRYAAVNASHVLAGATTDPEKRLYYTLLHALLRGLSRLPTKHSDGWSGTFLVPAPDCDLEYRYPAAYGPTPEERTRAAAEGWKNYLEAILNGTAMRYVPHFDDPEAEARRLTAMRDGRPAPS